MNDNCLPMIAALMLFIVVFAMTKMVKDEAAKSGNRMVLEYGNPLKICAVVFLLFFVGSSTLLLPMDTAFVWILWIALGGGIVLGGYFIAESLLAKVFFDEDKLDVRSPWRSPRTITWGEIVEYRCNRARNRHELRLDTEGWIMLSTYMDGLESFLSTLRIARPDLLSDDDLTDCSHARLT